MAINHCRVFNKSKIVKCYDIKAESIMNLLFDDLIEKSNPLFFIIDVFEGGNG